MVEYKDGVYHATLWDGRVYRVEMVDSEWFFADGTGWREKMDPDEIVSLETSGKELEPNVVYKNTYPLTDFFPKE